MNCALAIRRGFPSTLSEKSWAVRSAIGRPVPSTMLTSTGTRSTADRNVCGAGDESGSCAANPIVAAITDAASNFIGPQRQSTSLESRCDPARMLPPLVLAHEPVALPRAHAIPAAACGDGDFVPFAV